MIGSGQPEARTSRLWPDALDVIEHEHRVQAELCNWLEHIADCLPNDVDRKLCAKVIYALRFELPLHHRDEEQALFPLLKKRALPCDNVHEILARLALDHATDESFTSELLESLDTLGNGEKVKNPDMVGYMLRFFFESYRRHICWEESIVLPLARLRLGSDDVKELEQAMSLHREPGNVNRGFMN